MTRRDDDRARSDDPIAVVNGYLRRFGGEVEAELDELDRDGYTDVCHGEVRVGINVLRESGMLLLLVRMGECPQDPNEASDLQRLLLELSFLATLDCAFAIDSASGAIYLRVARSLAGLDYVEFRGLLRGIVSVAEEMVLRVRL